MSKFLTYRTASNLGWLGMALLAVSWFLPSHSWGETVTEAMGLALTVTYLCASYHEKGYAKGQTEALKVEINRDWSKPEPSEVEEPYVSSEEAPFIAKTFRDWEPATEQEWLGNQKRASRVDDLHEPVSAYAQPASRAERKQQEQAYPGYSMLDEHHGQDAA